MQDKVQTMSALRIKGSIPKRGYRRGVVSTVTGRGSKSVPAGKVFEIKTFKMKKLRRPAAKRIFAITKMAETEAVATQVHQQKIARKRTEKKVITGSNSEGPKDRIPRGESTKVINLDTFLKPVSRENVVETVRRILGYNGKELLKP